MEYVIGAGVVVLLVFLFFLYALMAITSEADARLELMAADPEWGWPDRIDDEREGWE